MTIKTEIIALAVRLVAENTSLIRKPDAFESLITNIFGGETYDVRAAKEIEATTARVINSAKKMHVDREFKKIIKNV